MNNEELLNKALDTAVEYIYRSKAFSCGGYMCSVATTCYDEEEQKQICCRCLKTRYLEVAQDGR